MARRAGWVAHISVHGELDRVALRSLVRLRGTDRVTCRARARVKVGVRVKVG